MLRRTTPVLKNLFVPPRGTHDLHHADLFQQRHIEKTASSIVQNYGLTEIQTPTFDSKKLYQRSLGNTTDVVSKEMYTLQNTTSKGDGETDELVLRPVSVILFFVEFTLNY